MTLGSSIENTVEVLLKGHASVSPLTFHTGIMTLSDLEHRYIDQNVPKDLDIHLVVDNYATHKHEKIKRWIAARPRYHVHYTPTYASWLNQVEIWFGIITQKAIRRGTFKKVKDLIANIQDFTNHYNTNSQPFVWTDTAESILDKITRLVELIHGTRH